MEIANILGIFGLISNTAWPLFKSRKHMLLGQIVACIFMMFHFVFLKAETGAVIMLIAGIQATLAIPLERNAKFKNIYLLSMLFIPLIVWYTWHGLPSIFSSTALILYCIGNLQTNIIKMRLFLILCIFSWVIHNALISSIPGLISNFLAISTSIYALYTLFNSDAELATNENS